MSKTLYEKKSLHVEKFYLLETKEKIAQEKDKYSR